MGDPTSLLEEVVREEGLAVVGKSVARFDSLDKVLGKPIFTADIIPESAVHLKVVRSTVPHARIRRVDLTRARKSPGVVAVLTAEDIPGINESVALIPDRPLLATDRVRCLGEAIAIVAAEDSLSAEEAVDLVEVEYEPLPVVTSPLEAMRPDAPKIHDGGNIAKHLKVRKGDVEKGFREADVIVERTYRTSFQDPTPLETECGIAIPEPDGSVTCIGSLQSPFHVQTGVAKILGLRPEQVRIIQAATGGAFGPKSDEIPIDTCGMAALAAVKTQRPAVLIYTREESMVSHTKRHPFVIKLKTGAKKDGTLTACEALVVSDTGAYASLGPLVIIRACFHATGPYVIPNVKTDAYCVYTNNTMAGSFRGFGGPQANYAAECQMDEVAKELGMDPLDLRLINMLRPGTLTATSQLVDESCGLEECVVRAVEAADWRRKRREYEAITGPMKRGMGIALMYHGNSLGPEGNDYAAVHITVQEDGVVILRTGLTEYGTGAPSGLLQIAAEVLGLPMSYFRLEKPDTRYCNDTGPTVASRTIVIGGRATQIAAGKVKEKLQAVASSLLGCDGRDVVMRDGFAFAAKEPSRRVGFAELVKECYRRGVVMTETGFFIAPKCEYDPETSQGTTYQQYTYGAVVADVEVDTELGVVKPLRIIAAYDVGKAINPLSLEGQIEGGTVQGLGYALMEELTHRDGIVLNPTLGDYYIPTSLDIPEIKPIIVEYNGPMGPYGAKAMGEPPIDLPAPALANAITQAIGVRINDIPITPEKIVLTLKKMKRPM